MSSGVTANCLHPGVVATELSANYAGRLQSRDAPLAESARGAQTPIYLATSPEVEGVSGHYFVNKTPTRSSAASYDETLARQLWQVSEELSGLGDVVT
jgi:hypothetical protein